MVRVDGVEREVRTSPQHCFAITLIQRCDLDLEGRYWTKWLQWQTVRKWSPGRKLTVSTRSGHMSIFLVRYSMSHNAGRFPTRGRDTLRGLAPSDLMLIEHAKVNLW